MEVILEIHLISDKYEKNLKGSKNLVMVEEGTRVGDLLKHLDIPIEEVGFVVINGFVVKLDKPIDQGDKIQLFPPIQGG